MKKFYDRHAAGQALAMALQSYARKANTIVLGLPRGGVPVAYEIAKALYLPLDVFIVRKLGVPGDNELAMGAIASKGMVVFNQDILQGLSISQEEIDAVIALETAELNRRERMYRGQKESPTLKDKAIILVDDGIATGATLRAAIMAIKQEQPARIIVAVPVAPLSGCEDIEKLVDEWVCLLQPEFFYAVGAWYEHFEQTTDEEVSSLLKNSL